MQVWVELDHWSAFKHSTEYKLFGFSLLVQQSFVSYFNSERNGQMHHFVQATLLVAVDSMLILCCHSAHQVFFSHERIQILQYEKKPNFCFIGKQSMLPCPGSGFKPCVVDQGPFSPLLHRIEMDKLSELQVVREAGQGLKENLK